MNWMVQFRKLASSKSTSQCTSPGPHSSSKNSASTVAKQAKLGCDQDKDSTDSNFNLTEPFVTNTDQAERKKQVSRNSESPFKTSQGDFFESMKQRSSTPAMLHISHRLPLEIVESFKDSVDKMSSSMSPLLRSYELAGQWTAQTLWDGGINAIEITSTIDKSIDLLIDEHGDSTWSSCQLRQPASSPNFSQTLCIRKESALSVQSEIKSDGSCTLTSLTPLRSTDNDNTGELVRIRLRSQLSEYATTALSITNDCSSSMLIKLQNGNLRSSSLSQVTVIDEGDFDCTSPRQPALENARKSPSPEANHMTSSTTTRQNISNCGTSTAHDIRSTNFDDSSPGLPTQGVLSFDEISANYENSKFDCEPTLVVRKRTEETLLSRHELSAIEHSLDYLDQGDEMDYQCNPCSATSKRQANLRFPIIAPDLTSWCLECFGVVKNQLVPVIETSARMDTITSQLFGCSMSVILPEICFVQFGSNRLTMNDFSELEGVPGEEVKVLGRSMLEAEAIAANRKPECTEQQNCVTCIYAEMVLLVNVEGFQLPATQSKSESVTICNHFERRLKTAIGSLLQTTDKNDILGAMSLQASQIVSKSSSSSSSSRTANAPVLQPAFGVQSAFFPLGLITRNYPSIAKGAHVFSRPSTGGQIRAPQFWSRHQVYHSSSSGNNLNRRVLAYKFAKKDKRNDLTIGGFINHENHLKIIASTASFNGKQDYQGLNQLQSGVQFLFGRCFPNPSKSKLSSELRIHCYLQAPSLLAFLPLGNSQADVTSIFGLEKFQVKLQVLSDFEVSKLDCKPNTLKMESVIKEVSVGEQRYRVSLFDTALKHLNALASDISQNVTVNTVQTESLGYLLEHSEEKNLWCAIKHIYSTCCLPLSELDKMKTSHGGSLSLCIRPLAYSSEVRYPVASDAEAYELFSHLYDPIRSQHDARMSQPSPLADKYLPLQAQHTLTSACNIISHRVKFVRNLSDQPFYPCQSVADYQTIENRCMQIINSLPIRGDWYSIKDLVDNQDGTIDQLIDKNLTNNPTTSTLKKSLLAHRYWPLGRSLFVVKSINRSQIGSGLNLGIQINHEDHINIVCNDTTGKQLEKAFKTAHHIVNLIDQRCKFSWNQQFGLLSPNPLRCGAGLRLSALVSIHKNDNPSANIVCRRNSIQLDATEHRNIHRLVQRNSTCNETSPCDVLQRFQQAVLELTWLDAN